MQQLYFNDNTNDGVRFVLWASNKVMTSTLWAQYHLDVAAMVATRQKHKSFVKQIAKQIVNKLEHRGWGALIPSVRKHYLLVRHPLMRIESLYRNSRLLLMRWPNYSDTIPLDGRLYLFRHIVAHRSGCDQAHAPMDALMQIKFEDFIHYLPVIFADKSVMRYALYSEDHSKLQSLWPYGGVRFARILKMENSADIHFMRTVLRINTNITANRSGSKDRIPISWTPEMRKIMYRYYKDDFEQFDYDPLS